LCGDPPDFPHFRMSTPTHTAAAFNRKNPCMARLKHAVKLSKDGSPKDTRHFEIGLCGSGMTFEPGDSLAVLPTNCPDLVNDVLAALGHSGDESVTDLDSKPVTLREALTSSCAITIPDKKFLAAVAERAPGPDADELKALLVPERKDDLSAHLYGREVIDFLLQFPGAKFTPQEFVSLNKKVQVRLYSIASSLRAHPDEVHLTVATVRYQSQGRARKGVASTYLAERVTIGDTLIPTFINPGKGFRMPAPEEDTPIIMCGPGTGIAPFRAFLQERKAAGAKGRAWLFFGEISAKTDFFYEDEWAQFLKDGVLTRFDTAFSRDQAEKIYVQHRIGQAAQEFWKWLEEGAIFYVCGDASRMASDVDKALHRVIETAGGKTPDQAAEYVNQMKTDKRYRRDVY
jgi:sulfite reductase (NADPH) flavoprotein alpha-component